MLCNPVQVSDGKFGNSCIMVEYIMISVEALDLLTHLQFNYYKHGLT